jgi:hypothetical protein
MATIHEDKDDMIMPTIIMIFSESVHSTNILPIREGRKYEDL